MLSHRNQSIDLLSKSIDWFLYVAALAINELKHFNWNFFIPDQIPSFHVNGFIKHSHYIIISGSNFVINFVINGLTVSKNTLALFHFYILKYFCFDSLIKLFPLFLIFLAKNISSRRSFAAFISNSRFSHYYVLWVTINKTKQKKKQIFSSITKIDLTLPIKVYKMRRHYIREKHPDCFCKSWMIQLKLSPWTIMTVMTINMNRAWSMGLEFGVRKTFGWKTFMFRLHLIIHLFKNLSAMVLETIH